MQPAGPKGRFWPKERKLVAMDAIPLLRQTEARLCGLLLLICYALRSGSVFLASDWRLSS